GEEPEKHMLGHSVRTMLAARQYERLEALVDSLQRDHVCWVSGNSKLATVCGMGFGDVDDPGDPSKGATHLDQLRTWVDARPSSDLPQLAIAEALIGRAWAARGHGWARNVSSDRRQRFGDDLEEAIERLSQCSPETQKGLVWCSAMMRALHGAGEDSLYRELARESLERFPAEARLYVVVANHLMPRWYGDPGDWQMFADRATAALPDSIRDEFYARIVLDEAGYLDNVFEDGGKVDADRALRGLDQWQRRWPRAEEPRSGRAMLAWMAGDRATARQAFAALRDTCNVDVWRTLPRYWKARQWAERRGS